MEPFQPFEKQNMQYISSTAPSCELLPKCFSETWILNHKTVNLFQGATMQTLWASHKASRIVARDLYSPNDCAVVVVGATNYFVFM